MLKKKQSMHNDDWLRAVSKITQLVSCAEVNTATEKAIAEIRQKTRNKKSAYAWSGGKDSIVLGHIAERAGITDCMIGICNLEYAAFMNWIKENSPRELEIINTGQDLDWLYNHLEMLFPLNSNIAGRWFQIVQHKAQAQYYKEHQLDMMLLGRRRADGNYVGKGENIYTNAQGITRYSPIADWSHELILAYIHYNSLPLPPIYAWKNGYMCGTHPWPARQWTNGRGWQEVYEIDPSIVIHAAEKIESAKEFLEELNLCK